MFPFSQLFLLATGLFFLFRLSKSRFKLKTCPPATLPPPTSHMSLHKMSPPSSWFTEGYMRQAIQVGKVISLPHPQPSKWSILEVLREHDDQKYETAKDPSYASIELSCIEVEGHHRRSMMRIIMQVPYLGTEEKDSVTRAKQAMEFRTAEFRAFLTFAKKESTCTPRLLGYREDQQDSLSPIPGGFITYYAWQAVPGIRLGDYTGKAPQFWTLDKEEREKIRIAFRQIYS